MTRDVLLGFVKVHILHHALEAPIYGQWAMDELARHGYRLGPGTVYPLLRRMTEAGYLEREERVVGGRVRKYYRATARGREVLERVSTQIRELAGELLDQGPTGQGGNGRGAHRGKPPGERL